MPAQFTGARTSSATTFSQPLADTYRCPVVLQDVNQSVNVITGEDAGTNTVSLQSVVAALDVAEVSVALYASNMPSKKAEIDSASFSDIETFIGQGVARLGITEVRRRTAQSRNAVSKNDWSDYEKVWPNQHRNDQATAVAYRWLNRYTDLKSVITGQPSKPSEFDRDGRALYGFKSEQPVYSKTKGTYVYPSEVVS